MAKLGEVFTIASGGTPDKRNPSYYENGTIPWVKTGDLKNQYVPTGIDCITEEGLNNSSAKLFPPNTVLVAMYGATIGACSILSYEAATNQACAAFLPNENVLPTYLYYFLSSKRDQFVKDGVGGAQPNISAGYLKNVQFDLVPVRQQEGIVERLDKIENLIVLRKEQLAKLDQLVKSRFIELFMGKGYPTKTVDEVSIGKGEYGAQSASIGYDPTRPRYVRITDINDDGTLNDDVVASINPSDDEQYKLEYGDFMFARMGATVGKTYAFIEGNQIFAGYLIRYRLNPELINPRYLFWYTRLDEYWNWVKLNQSGAAQPGINAKKYGSLQIPLPPIEEQNAFAAFVEQTDKSKLAIQQSLDKLELLKKSLMQEYFG